MAISFLEKNQKKDKMTQETMEPNTVTRGVSCITTKEKNSKHVTRTADLVQPRCQSWSSWGQQTQNMPERKPLLFLLCILLFFLRPPLINQHHLHLSSSKYRNPPPTATKVLSIFLSTCIFSFLSLHSHQYILRFSA